MTTGNQFKDIRLKLGLTQAEIAKVLEVSKPTIQRVESKAVAPRLYVLAIERIEDTRKRLLGGVGWEFDH